jgi:hypothetical protein
MITTALAVLFLAPMMASRLRSSQESESR